MVTALAVLLAFVAVLALFDLAAMAVGFDSREGMTDDHAR